MEESKPVPKILIGVTLEEKLMTLQNISDTPIVFEFAPTIGGLSGKVTTVEPGYTLGVRLSVGITAKDPEKPA